MIDTSRILCFFCMFKVGVQNFSSAETQRLDHTLSAFRKSRRVPLNKIMSRRQFVLILAMFSAISVGYATGDILSTTNDEGTYWVKQHPCQKTTCPEGRCHFEDCSNAISCDGGLCTFERCNKPSCDGGLCTFKECSHPRCSGGKCKFFDTKVRLYHVSPRLSFPRTLTRRFDFRNTQYTSDDADYSHPWFLQWRRLLSGQRSRWIKYARPIGVLNRICGALPFLPCQVPRWVPCQIARRPLPLMGL